MLGIARAFAIKCVDIIVRIVVTEILMSCGKSVTQLAEHPLYNTILAFLLKEFGFQYVIRWEVFCLSINNTQLQEKQL